MKTVELGMRFVTIGRAGENGVSRISIDVSGWVAEYPNGTGAIVYKRPDGTTYPLVSECADGKLYAVLGATDTAISGTVKVEAQWLDDGKIAKSATYECVIERSIGEAGAVPTYRPSWVDEVLQAAAGIGSGGGAASAVEWDNVQSKPDTFPPAEHEHDASEITGLATVATTGSYNDLEDTPTIPAAVIIDDTHVSPDSTWSGKKIHELTAPLDKNTEKIILKTSNATPSTGLLYMTGNRGMITRVRNPGRFTSVRAFIQVTALTVGTVPVTVRCKVMSGESAIPLGTYADNLSAYASAEAQITAIDTLTQVDFALDAAVDAADENLYVAIWALDGSGRWLGNFTEDVTATSDLPNYNLGRYGAASSACTATQKITARAALFYLVKKESEMDTRIDTLDARVDTLEGLHDDDAENPLSVLKPDGGYCGIFNSICCIGDSLTAGAHEKTETGTTMYPCMTNYSYPTFMQRALGNTVLNLSFGGATAKAWLQSNGNSSDFTENPCDAYIIALGTNDLSQSGGTLTGTTADINTTDSTQTVTTTDIGAYGAIIQKIRALVPKAKIFVCTIPHTRNQDSQIMPANVTIRAIAELLSCAVIDLEKHGVQSADEAAWKEKYYNGGHLNTIGYKQLAVWMMSYIDYIIRHNMAEYDQAAFIQTAYEFGG